MKTLLLLLAVTVATASAPALAGGKARVYRSALSAARNAAVQKFNSSRVSKDYGPYRSSDVSRPKLTKTSGRTSRYYVRLLPVPFLNGYARQAMVSVSKVKGGYRIAPDRSRVYYQSGVDN